MSVASIALALRKSPFARIAIFAALAMLAYACVNEAPAPVPRDDSNAIAAEATAPPIAPTPRNAGSTIATEATAPSITPTPRNEGNAAVSPTPQVPVVFQELPTATPVSSEEKLPSEVIRALLTSTSSAPDRGFVSLEERILRSSIIARVTMDSVSAHAQARYTPVKYLPMIHFTFDVHEYLKGSGNNAITASVLITCANASCRFPDEQKAIDYASTWLSSQSNRWWETRESVVFLQEDNLINSATSAQSASVMYKFLPWNERRNSDHNYATTNQYPYSSKDGYSIRSDRNRVWLPSTSTSSDASGSAESRFMLGNKPRDLYPTQSVEGSSSSPDISLSDLKSRIKTLTDTLTSNEDTEDYDECLRVKLKLNRIPWTPYSIELPTKSGLSTGTVLDSGATGGLDHYDIYFFSGTDKDLFEIVIEDNDNDPYNNYYRTVKTLRPLVARDYSVVYHQIPGILRPCIGSPVEEYTNNPTANWTIRATAPAGTLHEAFFDPVAIGAAVGADGDNGALTPAAFHAAGGADAEIRRVDWDADVVTIAIANLPASLANHYIDFIALDGSVALRLDFGDAAVADAGGVRTFRWGVCGQPWNAGDKLMLRISESAAGVAGATNDATCMGEVEATSSATPATDGQPVQAPTRTPC